MLSFGLLALPFLELKSPTKTTSPCLLYFSTSTATSPNFLRICFTVLFDSGNRTSSVCLLPYSSTLEACRCLLRNKSPLLWYPYLYAFVELCVFITSIISHKYYRTTVGTLLPPTPYSCYPVPSSVSLSMRTL